jgi:hypothetical protein
MPALEFAGSGKPLTEPAFDNAIARLACDPAALWAILSVETRGFGYLPDRRPKILYERHIFASRTGHKFDAANPDISSSSSGGYLGGAAEFDRLARAIQLDRRAALESASWGLGQVMGFNAAGLGYASVESMVTAFSADEDAQLEGAVRFVLNNHALHDAVKAHNWSRAAFFYNGSGFAKNAYDTKLASAHALYSVTGQLPSLRVRTAQALLSYLNIDPRGVDGIIGAGTRAALLKFQTNANLDKTADLDDETEAKLKAAVTFA